MIVYGIPTCDTTRKAVAALEEAGQRPVFRDVRREPLSQPERERFLQIFGEKLVNRASTTWRGLCEAERAKSPGDLLAAHPALMKRPLIEAGGALHLGWGAEVQAALIGQPDGKRPGR